MSLSTRFIHRHIRVIQNCRRALARKNYRRFRYWARQAQRQAFAFAKRSKAPVIYTLREASLS